MLHRTGLEGTGWVDAPEGCPWWYLATRDSDEGEIWHGAIRLRPDKVLLALLLPQPQTTAKPLHPVDRDIGFDSTPEIRQNDLTECESGSCYVIDFHIELGGENSVPKLRFFQLL